jgi:hypothetical protein
MDSRVRILTKHLKKYDSDLFAERLDNGVIQISRHKNYWIPFQYEGKKYLYAKSVPHYVTVLTDTWLVTGKPRDWGIEPLMARIRDMDGYRNDTMLDQVRAVRERNEADKLRGMRNDFRAIAADMRKDFAKATSDINTSTVNKIDKRRLKDGYC